MLMTIQAADFSKKVGTYNLVVTSLANGKLAFIMGQHPDRTTSVTNLSEVLANHIIQNVPEVQGIPLQDIAWYETYWLCTLQNIDNGKNLKTEYTPEGLFTGYDHHMGRMLRRVEFDVRDNITGFELQKPKWRCTDNAPYLLNIIELEYRAQGGTIYHEEEDFVDAVEKLEATA